MLFTQQLFVVVGIVAALSQRNDVVDVHAQANMLAPFALGLLALATITRWTRLRC